MSAAIVQLCVDPRLNHDVLRAQVRTKLAALGLAADSIFLTNDVGGNIGSNTLGTLELLRLRRDTVVFGAILHHDDCLAAQAGLREPLDESVARLEDLFDDREIDAPVFSGHVTFPNNELVWTDEPRPSTETSSFRMPRMFGG